MVAANTNGNAITRESLLASWRGAQKTADAEGVVRLNPASCAGQALAHTEGDAELALTMLPKTDGPFWSVVAGYLERVSKEERT